MRLTPNAMGDRDEHALDFEIAVNTERAQRDVSMLNENSALGRMVSPEEVARAVCFLASEDASAVTGANLPLDCGWLVTPSWHTYGGLRPARR
jgi:NAD(P)-dependent dehydrogenase (short-subunit alcohol dehydrogenase family)